ncbi:hypothetical protein [Actinacidiphila sp. bgisy160]|uniref:hypothetical protein n=1 Tax=Actinacidiphila sp. bgisy160 TaxID=3413796 RepID=UPI003D72A05E
MTDDYAAIVSAVIAAVLVLGFVETHAFLHMGSEHAKNALAEGLAAKADAMRNIDAGIAPSEAQLARLAAMDTRASRARTAASGQLMAAGCVWIGLVLALVAALCLVVLWAAVDGHGPARWLAIYSSFCAALGVFGVALGALARALQPLLGAFRNYLRAERFELDMDPQKAAELQRHLAEYRRSHPAPAPAEPGTAP